MPAPALPSPSVVRPDALLAPLAPAEAYAADVARLNGRAPIGAADDAWVALAQTVSRAAALPTAERAEVLTAGADHVSVLVPAGAAEEGVAATLRQAVGALRALAGRLARGAVRRRGTAGAGDPALYAAVEALQGAVAQEEQSGAFMLAFATLAGVREALRPVLDGRAEGLLLAQQGRVARQAGALTTAGDLYEQSARVGRSCQAPDVEARALIGAGMLAVIRGNYPAARANFDEAFRPAGLAMDPRLTVACHQGIFLAAIVSRDLNCALSHGWECFQRCGASPEDQAELLVNLAAVSLQLGEPRAALGACLRAMSLCSLPRLLLPALGTAISAARDAADVQTLERLLGTMESSLNDSPLIFESTHLLVEAAEACSEFGRPEAREYANRALVLASYHGYHEAAFRAETVLSTISAMRSDSDSRMQSHRGANRPTGKSECLGGGVRPSKRSKEVLRNLEGLSSACR